MAQLFVGQLPFSKFFPDDLLNLFQPYGHVIAHQLHIHQGNAFVTYATTDEADRAIQGLHGQCALGTRSQPIQVMYSKGTRLISAFGLHHRSLCLARNKNRHRSKENSSASAAGGSATPAPLTGVDSEPFLNGPFPGNSTTAPGKAPSRSMVLSPLMCSVPGAAGAIGSGLTFSMPAPGPSEEPNASFATLLSSLGELSGRSELSVEDETRQASGPFGAMPTMAGLPLSLESQAQQQQQPQQQQQQQKRLSYPLGANPFGYSGTSASWTAGRHPSLATGTVGASTALSSLMSSSSAANSTTTPLADIVSPGVGAAAPVTYVMMQSPGYPVPCVMPLYYSLPPTNPTLSPTQQQQLLVSMLSNPNGGSASGLASLPSAFFTVGPQ